MTDLSLVLYGTEIVKQLLNQNSVNCELFCKRRPNIMQKIYWYFNLYLIQVKINEKKYFLKSYFYNFRINKVS